MWNNINSLATLANTIQWISITMVFVGGIMQIGKHFVDRRVNYLKELNQANTEIIRSETETKLNSQIESLTLDNSERKIEIDDLKKKTAYVDPYLQPIQSANASVYVVIQSNEELGGFYADQGGNMIFMKGTEEILLLSSTECRADTLESEKIKFSGLFNLDSNHPIIGNKITFLKNAEYIQIQFLPLENNYQVIEGKAICIFNGNARIEFIIPKQKMKNRTIYIEEISSSFENVYKK